MRRVGRGRPPLRREEAPEYRMDCPHVPGTPPRARLADGEYGVVCDY
jgi:hypothetical protein